MKTIRRKARICALFLTAFCIACNQSFVNATVRDTREEENGEVPAGQTDGYQKVAEQGTLSLYVDMSTADFYIFSSETEQYYYATVRDAETDPVANNTVMDRMRSVLAIEYYDNKNVSYQMNSYADCLAYGQVTASKTADGVRAVFSLGQKDTRRLIPNAVTQERFEAYLEELPAGDKTKLKSYYLFLKLEDIEDAGERQELLRQYPKLTETALYILRPEQSVRTLSQIETYFGQLGLGLDDVDRLNEEAGIVVEQEVKPVFTIPVEYRLEGDGFVARILNEEIQTPAGYILSSITFLEFFVSASSEDSGCFFVPDGSGALISLNKASHTRSFIMPVYGLDDAIKQEERSFFGQKALMPVFGIDYSAHGVLAIIESGAYLASINANLSGLLSSHNNIFTSFTVSPSSFLQYDKRMLAKGVYLFPQDISRTPIQLRYMFLEADESDYIGMAKAYRKYLEGSGKLQRQTTADGELPCVIELLGSIEKQKSFMGIPYTSSVALTDFRQAQEIVKDAAAAGMKNLRVRYTGWSNGGLSHTVNNRLKIQKELGGKQGLIQLAAALREQGIPLYPDADFLYVNKDKLFDGFTASKDASAFLDRKIATVSSYDMASYYSRTDSVFGQYIVSPNRIRSHIEGYLSAFDQLGLSSISVGSMGRNVNSDFNRKATVERNEAGAKIVESLQLLREEHSLLTEGGNAYVLPYVDTVVDLALMSSYLAIEDESVPFYQIVVHGYVTYMGEAVNTAQNYRENLLKTVETGAGLYFKWMYAPDDTFHDTNYQYDNYSLCYKNWLSDAGGIYGRITEVLRDTAGETIEGHQKLAEKVYQTTFSNGVSVIVNYNAAAIELDGVVIGAEDFIRKESDGSHDLG